MWNSSMTWGDYLMAFVIVPLAIACVLALWEWMR